MWTYASASCCFMFLSSGSDKKLKQCDMSNVVIFGGTEPGPWCLSPLFSNIAFTLSFNCCGYSCNLISVKKLTWLWVSNTLLVTLCQMAIWWSVQLLISRVLVWMNTFHVLTFIFRLRLSTLESRVWSFKCFEFFMLCFFLSVHCFKLWIMILHH